MKLTSRCGDSFLQEATHECMIVIGWMVIGYLLSRIRIFTDHLEAERGEWLNTLATNTHAHLFDKVIFTHVSSGHVMFTVGFDPVESQGVQEGR